MTLGLFGKNRNFLSFSGQQCLDCRSVTTLLRCSQCVFSQKPSTKSSQTQNTRHQTRFTTLNSDACHHDRHKFLARMLKPLFWATCTARNRTRALCERNWTRSHVFMVQMDLILVTPATWGTFLHKGCSQLICVGFYILAI